MVPLHVIQLFKRSCPEQIACTFWALFTSVYNEKGGHQDAFSVALWVKMAVLFCESEPPVSGQVKIACQRRWCDAWWWIEPSSFFLSLSPLPPTVPLHSPWPEHVGKRRWNKIQNPFQPRFGFASTISPLSVWSLQSGISGEYCLWQAESVNRWCYWTFDFDWIFYVHSLEMTWTVRTSQRCYLYWNRTKSFLSLCF